MVLFNYSTKELTAKVVYYGPGLCGKTTNLQFIHANLPETVKGKMLSLATKTDRTLFFDFLPLDLGTIRGMKTRIQLYTVPGQVFYNETRKLVLKGADGIVFVADSQEQMMGANVESFRNLEENLKAHGMNLAELPHVIQFNKRDLPRLASIEEMNAAINRHNAPFYESVATTGIGVQDTLKAITKLVLLYLTKKYDPKARSSQAAAVAAPAPTPAAPPSTPAPQPEAASEGVPISGVESAEGGTAESGPQEIPLETPAAEVRTGPPPPPDFHGTGSEEAPTFDDSEIDDLVGEVEDDGAGPFPAAEEPDGAPAMAAAGGEAGSPEEISLGFEEDEVESEEAIPVVLEETAEEEPAAMSEPTAPDEIVPLAAKDSAPASDGGGFEIDQGFDPQWTTDPGPVEVAPSRTGDETVAMSASEVMPVLEEADEEPADVGPLRMESETPAASAPAEPEEAPGPVVLTEVADGPSSLFEDPSLEVTRLAAGAAQEIQVPVEMGEGEGKKRFKLSITLRLDPVD